MMFNASPMTRIEYVHPDDVGLGVVRALHMDDAIGQVLNLGGGEACRIVTRDLFDTVFGSLGLPRMPDEAFGDGPYYSDWLDTDRSAVLLGYQRHSFDDFAEECQRNLRFIRPLIRALGPLVTWGILRYSEPWRARHK